MGNAPTDLWLDRQGQSESMQRVPANARRSHGTAHAAGAAFRYGTTIRGREVECDVATDPRPVVSFFAHSSGTWRAKLSAYSLISLAALRRDGFATRELIRVEGAPLSQTCLRAEGLRVRFRGQGFWL